MDQNLSRIDREEYREWLELPCTQELIHRLLAEEEAHRTLLGAGAGIRERNVLVAGSVAIELNAKADALAHFRNKMKNYEDVVRDDRKEVNNEANEVVEGDSEGEDVSVENSWASPAREAIRRAAGEPSNRNASDDGAE